MHRAFLVPAVIAFSLTSPALAQAVNIDFGADFDTPSPGYAGPAGQFGLWNTLTGNDIGPFPVVDISGLPTTVTLTFNLPFGSGSYDTKETLGDDQALLDDYLALHSSPAEVEIRGLVPGRYALYTYAWTPDNPLARTLVLVNGKDTQKIGGFFYLWPRENLQFAVHRLHVGADATVTIFLRGIPQGSLNGLQIVPLH